MREYWLVLSPLSHSELVVCWICSRMGKMCDLGWCFPEGSIPQCPLANAFEFGQLKVGASVLYLFFSVESSAGLELLLPGSKTAECLASQLDSRPLHCLRARYISSPLRWTAKR